MKLIPKSAWQRIYALEKQLELERQTNALLVKETLLEQKEKYLDYRIQIEKLQVELAAAKKPSDLLTELIKALTVKLPTVDLKTLSIGGKEKD